MNMNDYNRNENEIIAQIIYEAERDTSSSEQLIQGRLLGVEDLCLDSVQRASQWQPVEFSGAQPEFTGKIYDLHVPTPVVPFRASSNSLLGREVDFSQVFASQNSQNCDLASALIISNSSAFDIHYVDSPVPNSPPTAIPISDIRWKWYHQGRLSNEKLRALVALIISYDDEWLTHKGRDQLSEFLLKTCVTFNSELFLQEISDEFNCISNSSANTTESACSKRVLKILADFKDNAVDEHRGNDAIYNRKYMIWACFAACVEHALVVPYTIAEIQRKYQPLFKAHVTKVNKNPEVKIDISLPHDDAEWFSLARIASLMRMLSTAISPNRNKVVFFGACACLAGQISKTYSLGGAPAHHVYRIFVIYETEGKPLAAEGSGLAPVRRNAVSCTPRAHANVYSGILSSQRQNTESRSRSQLPIADAIPLSVPPSGRELGSKKRDSSTRKAPLTRRMSRAPSDATRAALVEQSDRSRLKSFFSAQFLKLELHARRNVICSMLEVVDDEIRTNEGEGNKENAYPNGSTGRSPKRMRSESTLCDAPARRNIVTNNIKASKSADTILSQDFFYGDANDVNDASELLFYADRYDYEIDGAWSTLQYDDELSNMGSASTANLFCSNSRDCQ